jgi:3-hydroxypropanoate dehydrogenase
VDPALLRELYDLAKLAPTSANSQPVTAIVAHDLEFYEHLPKLLPHVDARSWFARRPADQLERTASQGSSMQGAYLILAARALGLDAGPIGGFDAAKVDAEFFPDSPWRTNFLVNLGYGDRAGLLPRSPRLDFDEACRIV